MENVFDTVWDASEDHPGYEWNRIRLARRLFRRGPEGAHQVINTSDGEARVLMVSTMIEPEIAEYPDSGKVGVFAGRAPGAEGEARLWKYLDVSAERSYFDGE